MFIKIIRSYRDVVALCDADILGKHFGEGKFQLDVKENFYKGEKTGESEVIDILQKMAVEDATFNIVGEKSVKAAIKARIIDENSVGKIQGIPFALVLD